jgi:hypothetical protein
MQQTLSQIFPSLFALSGNTVSNYLGDQIQDVCRYLKIETRIIKSSEIPNPCNLNGENRILQICNLLGAKNYINASGGVSLYSPEKFRQNGVKLRFLPTYTGNMVSILEQIVLNEFKLDR